MNSHIQVVSMRLLTHRIMIIRIGNKKEKS